MKETFKKIQSQTEIIGPYFCFDFVKTKRTLKNEQKNSECLIG